jgi:hypothetical protein
LEVLLWGSVTATKKRGTYFPADERLCEQCDSVNQPPQHGTPAGKANLAIERLAHRSSGDVQELLTLFALMGCSHAWPVPLPCLHARGSVLLAAFSLRRPTKDIDLQASDIANDADSVLGRF